MTDDFDEGEGLGYVIVTREHTGGKLSLAVYFIDTWCVGVKGSFFRLRVEEEELEELLEQIEMAGDLKEVSYNEAHNMVWGSVAFAEEAGIKPGKDFALTQYFLEEDTDDVPLIEYDYGHDGKHFLVAKSNLELTTYLPTLKKNLEEGEYSFIVEDEEEAEEEEQDDELPTYYQYDAPYTYRGHYPTQAEAPAFPEVAEALAASDNYLTLPDSMVDHILSLPHDALRHQLEQTILYGLGQLQACDGDWDKAGTLDQVFMHAVILLGGLDGGEDSLKVILETLRQPYDAIDFIYGDTAHLVIIPALAKLGATSLPLLKSFIFEEGIPHCGKSHIFETVSEIAQMHPEKRDEVIRWFGSIIDRINEEGTDALFTNHTLNGLLVSELANLHTEELLPKIKEIFDNDLIDWHICGSWKDVEHDTKAGTYHKERCETDIKQIYKALNKTFGKN